MPALCKIRFKLNTGAKTKFLKCIRKDIIKDDAGVIRNEIKSGIARSEECRLKLIKPDVC